MKPARLAPAGDVFSKIIAVTAPAAGVLDRRAQAHRRALPDTDVAEPQAHAAARTAFGSAAAWSGPSMSREFLAEYVDLPAVHLPAIASTSIARQRTHRGDRRPAARVLECGLGPLTDLAPLLEYNGMVVIEEPVRCDDMDAVSRWQGGWPYARYVADEEGNSRKLFNLAHEFGHLVLHNGDRSEQPQSRRWRARPIASRAPSSMPRVHSRAKSRTLRLTTSCRSRTDGASRWRR